jgi:hypothetical protein
VKGVYKRLHGTAAEKQRLHNTEAVNQSRKERGAFPPFMINSCAVCHCEFSGQFSRRTCQRYNGTTQTMKRDFELAVQSRRDISSKQQESCLCFGTVEFRHGFCSACLCWCWNDSLFDGRPQYQRAAPLTIGFVQAMVWTSTAFWGTGKDCRRPVLPKATGAAAGWWRTDRSSSNKKSNKRMTTSRPMRQQSAKTTISKGGARQILQCVVSRGKTERDHTRTTDLADAHGLRKLKRSIVFLPWR